MKKVEFIGVGRRKTATGTVWLRPGDGKITVNGRAFEAYFECPMARELILLPLHKSSELAKVDLLIRVSGGGIQGQAVAVRLGLARALVLEDDRRRQDLKSAGFLTRDARRRERQKPGFAGARKRFQYSKR